SGFFPLGQELNTTYKNDFKHVVKAWWPTNFNLAIGEKKTSQIGTFMDPEGLELFSFKMKEGSWKALDDPASIVLSESAARALFGDKDPINQTLAIANTVDVKVTGIYEDFPQNSTFTDLKFVSSWDLWINDPNSKWLKINENNWNEDLLTFVEIHPNGNFEDISAKIKDVKIRHIPQEQGQTEHPEVFLEPMSTWHLYSDWKGGKSIGGKIQYVWLFGMIGSFVLLLACINFMNLSTAQSEKRAREVGIRKSIGSERSQLVVQFLSESFVVVLFAFMISLALVTLVLPLFNELTDKRMDWPWGNLKFWLASALFIAVTSLISGSYPALYLSSFEPVKVLKGTYKAGRSASIPRKFLVVLQFSVSIALIIGTVVVWQQVQYAKNRPVGYSRQGLITIRKTMEFYNKTDALENQLKASGAVVDMAESSSPTTAVWFTDSGFNWRGKDPNNEANFVTMAVTHDFGKTIGWQFVQGRDFSKEHSTDSSGLILNETAARSMGFDNPIDEEVTWNGKKLKVIGVIKDMVVTSPFEPVKQTLYYVNYEQGYNITMRVNPAISMSKALAKINKVFQSLIPVAVFDYKFVDQEYALKFSDEERIGTLASAFSVLAIFISCLGLFGMSSFIAEQRRKEIGIRKVLGASVSNVWKMLSIEFIQLVGFACVIGIPIAWYYLSEWLQRYTYRIEISVWVLVLSAAGAMFITLLTVSFQTLKASLGNPVNSLRSE
ncbi:MAG: FtsX-like permease family protein, partial [Chryseolinea sp.]